MLAFVNGLGGTPLIELYILFNEVAKALGERGITIARTLVGNYITSLEMAGASITLLVLDDELTCAVGRAGQDGRAALGRVTPDVETDGRRRHRDALDARTAPRRSASSATT